MVLELNGQFNELGLPLDPFIAYAGGGMLSGVAIASKDLASKTLVFGAEPSGASDAQRSFRDRTFHPSVIPTTIADGLLMSLGENAVFPLVLENVDDIFTVIDWEIAMATKLIWERLKIVVEPSACVTLAVLLYPTESKERMATLQQHYGQQVDVGLVLSGGNVDLGSCLEILSKAG
jgi:threonine dehydratase/serine racemase